MKKSLWPAIVGLIFILAGLNHFFNPLFYIKIMPSYLTNHDFLIAISGLAEVICGVLLIIRKTRRAGAWLTILLLIAIFPANIQMTVNEYENRTLLFYLSLLRLPLQFLLIWWVYTFTKSKLNLESSEYFQKE